MYVARRATTFGWPERPVGWKHDLRGGRDVAEHSHDFAEVVLIVTGEGTQISAAGRIPLNAGTVVMMRPGAWHGTIEARSLEFYNLYLSPELFAGELAWVLGSDLLTANLLRGEERPLEAALDATERMTAWFQQLENWGARLDRPALLGLASCLLAEVAGPASEVDAATSGIVAVMSAITDDVARPWTMAELARISGLSPSQLHRRFTARLGRPVFAWIDQKRGESAARLLAGSDATIAEVGRRVGWGDPSYASRRFRRWFGMTPTEHRARFRGA